MAAPAADRASVEVPAEEVRPARRAPALPPASPGMELGMPACLPEALSPPGSDSSSVLGDGSHLEVTSTLSPLHYALLSRPWDMAVAKPGHSTIREGTVEFAARAESEGPRTPARAAESPSTESASESPPQLRTPRSPGAFRIRDLSPPRDLSTAVTPGSFRFAGDSDEEMQTAHSPSAFQGADTDEEMETAYSPGAFQGADADEKMETAYSPSAFRAAVPASPARTSSPCTRRRCVSSPKVFRTPKTPLSTAGAARITGLEAQLAAAAAREAKLQGTVDAKTARVRELEPKAARADELEAQVAAERSRVRTAHAGLGVLTVVAFGAIGALGYFMRAYTPAPECTYSMSNFLGWRVCVTSL